MECFVMYVGLFRRLKMEIVHIVGQNSNLVQSQLYVKEQVFQAIVLNTTNVTHLNYYPQMVAAIAKQICVIATVHTKLWL